MTLTNADLDAVVVTDHHLIIRYVNSSFEHLTGYKAGELPGQSLRRFECVHHPPTFYARLCESATQGRVWSGQIAISRNDGNIIEVEATLCAVYDGCGRPFAYFGMGHGVADMALAEARLHHLQKTETLAMLAGGIAHDFNNLLSAIVGYTELAMVQIPENSGAQRDLAEVLRASGRAQGLIQQILAFSREREDETGPVRVELVLDEALALLRATLPTTIEIRRSVHRGCGIVKGNASRIHQVIMNLCTNAYHAMRERGGVLRITMKPIQLDQYAPPAFPQLPSGGYLILEVRDTGCGIDRVTLEHVFEPYFTTKAAGEGTGLGLSTALGIVRGLGGAITVHSRPGEGSVFRVFLPTVPQEMPEHVGIVEAPPRGNGERILFVDDEEILVSMGTRVLEHLGYEVTARYSPVDALEAFRCQPNKFHLVVADQTMPHLTGLDLAREVRRIRPDIPIILTTGFSELLTPDRLATLQIAAVLMKPMITQDLARALRRALDTTRQ